MERNNISLVRRLTSLAIGAGIGGLLVTAVTALGALVALKTGSLGITQTLTRLLAALLGGFTGGFCCAGRIGKKGLLWGAGTGLLTVLLLWAPASAAGQTALWPWLLLVVSGGIGGIVGVTLVDGEMPR